MKRILKFSAVLFAAFSFAMCSNNNTIPPESSWEVEYVKMNGNNLTVPENQEGTMLFQKGNSIGGQCGCNRFFGEYKITEGNRISFSNVGMTRMMCPDMEFETAYVDAINTASSFSVDDNRLLIRNASGEVTAVLRKAAAKAE